MKIAYSVAGLLTIVAGALLLSFLMARPTDDWDTTETRVLFARQAVEDYRADFGEYPPLEEGLSVLMRKPPAHREGPRYRKDHYVSSPEGLRDTWGRPLGYAISHDGCLVYSLGADGALGGLRDNADIIRRCIDQRAATEVTPPVSAVSHHSPGSM